MMQTNLSRIFAVSLLYNPGSIGIATAAADSAITIPGVRAGDIVLVASKPTQTAGLGVVGARVSGDNTVIVSFVNPTAGAIDAGAELWTFVIGTPDPGMLPSTVVT
jgi:hypothetical protein